GSVQIDFELTACFPEGQTLLSPNGPRAWPIRVDVAVSAGCRCTRRQNPRKWLSTCVGDSQPFLHDSACPERASRGMRKGSNSEHTSRRVCQSPGNNQGSAAIGRGSWRGRETPVQSLTKNSRRVLVAAGFLLSCAVLVSNRAHAQQAQPEE